MLRTNQEIEKRKLQIQELLRVYSPWGPGGGAQESRRRYSLLKAKEDEIRWLMGEEVDIRDWVTRVGRPR